MKEFTRSCSHILNNMLCTSSLVVQFSKINAAHFVPQPVRCSTVPCCAVSLRQPIYYTTFFSVCQGVFQKFFEVFFEAPFQPLIRLPDFPRSGIFLLPRFGRSIIISLFFPFVKGFSKSFFGFFLIRFLEAFPAFGRIGFFLSALFECLHSIPLFSPLVNPFS